MSETDAQEATDEATPAGVEPGQDAKTEQDAAVPEKMFTQSELDSRISAGIKSYQKNTEAEREKQRKQDEAIALLKDGEYKQLYEQTQADLDAIRADSRADKFQVEANGVLVKLGMSHYSDALIPGVETIDELMQRAEAFKAGVASAAEAEVAKRLDTGTHRVPTNIKPTEPVGFGEMTTEQFVEYKRQNKLV
jgi:hypothetical protein